MTKIEIAALALDYIYIEILATLADLDSALTIIRLWERNLTGVENLQHNARSWCPSTTTTEENIMLTTRTYISGD